MLDLQCTKTTEPDTDTLDLRESEIFDHLADNEQLEQTVDSSYVRHSEIQN